MHRSGWILVLAALLAFPVGGRLLTAQPAPAPLDRVLVRMGDTGGAGPPAMDRGSAGLWQRLLKLRTTASVLHTTAHPDDEQAGMLTLLSRGLGARTALLTLNRGEGGANAVGAELFDALGLVRTEELRLAGRTYGLDDQYFTSAVDYGYSKTLEEALRSWDRERLLEDMVRVIRLNRPLVVVSRFHGSPRDGHGHHQAAGRLTPEAVQAAADPTRFPEQLTQEGLRPWRPLKLYRGGVREDEGGQVRVDAGVYSPWLGDSYQNVGMTGLSRQRSQTAGRLRRTDGPAPFFYERLLPVDGPAQEAGFFDGLDTSIAGLFALTGELPPPGAQALVETLAGHVAAAVAAFTVDDPLAVVPALVRGLETTRAVLALTAEQPEAAFLLRVKERQFEEALHAALGLRIDAVGVTAGTEAASSPWEPLPTMGAVVPGQAFRVQVTLLNPTAYPVTLEDVSLGAGPGWRVHRDAPVGHALQDNAPATTTFTVQVPEAPTFSEPYFGRASIRENHYRMAEPALRALPERPPALVVAVSYTVDGVQVTRREPVRTREADLPNGYVLHELTVAPALAVSVAPARRVAPLGTTTTLAVAVDVQSNAPAGLAGDLRLDVPAGWTVEPERLALAFTGAGERRTFRFAVTAPELDAREYPVRAVATAAGRTYDRGYVVLRHRDLEPQMLYRPAVARVRGIAVHTVPGLRVGYVMGVGDDVPDAITQLGATVDLLTPTDLSTGDLALYDAVVIGTRAYAVRDDLRTYNRRLLDYARAGGTLVVLYQTPEFDPNTQAPYPASLPDAAEETSEEDAPVRLLAPAHPVLTTPNAITPADFDDWIEQRGSKFFADWDGAYTPLIETHDTDQEPQQGVLLAASYGEGRYIYCALALHRQLPYAVPGAYRLLANLLARGQP